MFYVVYSAPETKEFTKLVNKFPNEICLKIRDKQAIFCHLTCGDALRGWPNMLGGTKVTVKSHENLCLFRARPCKS
jgi:hypothetical protein